jgi:competence protein ComGC
MDKLKSDNGGTLLEIVLILAIILSLSMIWIKPNSLKSQNSKAFISSVIHTQMMALYLNDSIELKTDTLTEYPIRFNSNGNINMGQTISFGIHKVVIMLGTGRIHEKRIHDD